MGKRRTYRELENELTTAQSRLEELEETIRAIKGNEVDALVIDGPDGGQQVFTLQGADQPYRTLMETMAEGALTMAADGTILYCNQRLGEMLRLPINRIIGMSLQDIMLSQDWQAFKALLTSCEIEGCRGEYHLITHDGSEITVYVSARSLVLQGIQSFCMVATDLTAQHRLEREVRQSQKLEALGTLAGGIAHDFNNVLAAIMGFTEIVLEELGTDSPEHRRLELVLKGAERGRDLVKQILAFSRQGEQERESLVLARIVEEVLKLLKPAFPSTIEVISKNPPEDYRVFANPVQMHQVIMNLCTNAAHAMEQKGGILEISVLGSIVADGSITPVPEMMPGEYVVLKVGDTGSGMKPETLDRIFDPFFTTKKEGTGLGLSVSHGIVKSHGGYIAVESKQGEGSTFQVYLPRVRKAAAIQDKETAPLAEGKERILIVDDEDMLVELNQQRLMKLGYDVVGTTSSTDALRIFRKDPEGFDLVITDQTMPNMTGIDLAVKLMKIRADVPIILCTGQNDIVLPETAREIGIQGFLMKPLVNRELAQIIRRVLDAKTKL
ncbi:MAG: hybrid sensor histidine kinase/response regulator [Syntrophorhabdaceae bacterium]